MNSIENMKSRRSIRKFKDEKVSHEVIEEIVEIARFSPSWKNTQITRYHLIENEELRNKIAESCVMGFTYNTKTLLKAPALMVLSYVAKRSGFERDGSYTTSKGDAWEMFDVGVAAQTFALAACEKGVGTCMMGIFDEQQVAEAIGLSEKERVGVLIALGYPDEEPEAPRRKEVADLLSIH
ncbi:MAG: nitroreductase family protein [Ruminococcus sp.]|nr:nitroreductase family protein [Ruminococcus sp.]